jgi:hypothetical protein
LYDSSIVHNKHTIQDRVEELMASFRRDWEKLTTRAAMIPSSRASPATIAYEGVVLLSTCSNLSFVRCSTYSQLKGEDLLQKQAFTSMFKCAIYSCNGSTEDAIVMKSFVILAKEEDWRDLN